MSSTSGVGKPEIWFSDEARVGQKGTHAYVWAPIGSRPAMVGDNRHDSVHMFAAICADRGVGAAIIMPTVNTAVINEHLKEISKQVAPDAHAVLAWTVPGGIRPAAHCACQITSPCCIFRQTPPD